MLVDVLFATKMVPQISKSHVPTEKNRIDSVICFCEHFISAKTCWFVFFFFKPSILSLALPNTASEMLTHIPQHESVFPFLHCLEVL